MIHVSFMLLRSPFSSMASVSPLYLLGYTPSDSRSELYQYLSSTNCLLTSPLIFYYVLPGFHPQLYSSGNIILTDYRYEILQLLRSHKYDDETSVAVRHVYPTNHATVNEKEDQPELDNPDAFLSWLGASSIKASESKRKKNQKRLQLKQLLLRKDSGVSQLGTSIMEHCILQAGLNPSLIIVTTVDGKVKDLCTDNAIALIGTFQEAKRLMNSLSCVSEPGFIIVSDDVEKGRAGSSRVYIEFVPHLLMQHNPNKAISFKSFDTAVDEFFSRAEDQKIQMSIQTAEAAAQKRVQAVRESNEKRISVLHERQEQLLLEATALESSAETAELALSVLRSAVDNGIDWQQLKEHIKAEKIAGNPVAALVTEDLLKLSDGIAVLELPSPCGEDHSVMVSVRLELSAHANVRSIYDDRRRAVQKAERTLAASEKAISAAERYSQRELQNLSLKHSLAMEKKSLWFEKFYWFVSSENYLVLSGRDARQSQVLVSQYLRPCDVYVHTDIEGAHFCIIHNKDVNSPVSPVALLETGCMAVCRSRAWSSRARTSAWWVNADQVVHIAPAAENLPIGISIHGKKNFLPPHQLEMGLGLLFRIDDAGAERHKDERSDRGLSALAASEFGVVATECGVDYSRSCEKNGFATGEVMNTRYDNNSNSVNECDAAGKNGCIAYTFTTSVEGGSQAQRKRGGIGSKPGRSLTATTKGHPPPTQSSQDSLSSSCMAAAEHLVKPQTSDKVPRGKKGKMKLIKKKYRDQDDEDRELALELLGKQRNGGTTKQNALFKQKSCKNGSKKVSALKKDAARQGALKEVVSRMNADAVAQRQRLSEEVQSYLAMLETGGLLPVGGFDYHALQCLEEFESEEALSILKDYSTSNLDTIRNKSGLLLGIIRRYAKAHTCGLLPSRHCTG